MIVNVEDSFGEDVSNSDLGKSVVLCIIRDEPSVVDVELSTNIREEVIANGVVTCVDEPIPQKEEDARIYIDCVADIEDNV